MQRLRSRSPLRRERTLMLNEQARITDEGWDHVLVQRGDKPRGPHWHEYRLVSAEQACSVVRRVVTRARIPNSQLLRLLDLRAHSPAAHPASLERAIQRSMWRYELYRVHPRLTGAVLAPLLASRPPAPAPLARKPTHFVIVETVSPTGTPVPGVALAVTAPDGSSRTLMTDSYGRASVDGIDAGMCRIELPGIDRSLWSADGARGELIGTEACAPHIVRQGEGLSAIAERHGCPGWQVVWDDPLNAELRAKRKSPHILLPGDRVHLPERELGLVERRTDATHRIVVDRPAAALVAVRLQLESRWKRAWEGLTYTLSYMHQGELVTRPGAAPSSPTGIIEEKIPASVESVWVAFERPKLRLMLRIGALDPLQDGADGPAVETGVRARLRALGYAQPGLAALAQFQQIELGSAQPAGKLDAPTRDKLEELYGA